MYATDWLLFWFLPKCRKTHHQPPTTLHLLNLTFDTILLLPRFECVHLMVFVWYRRVVPWKKVFSHTPSDPAAASLLSMSGKSVIDSCWSLCCAFFLLFHTTSLFCHWLLFKSTRSDSRAAFLKLSAGSYYHVKVKGPSWYHCHSPCITYNYCTSFPTLYHPYIPIFHRVNPPVSRPELICALIRSKRLSLSVSWLRSQLVASNPCQCIYRWPSNLQLMHGV